MRKRMALTAGMAILAAALVPAAAQATKSKVLLSYHSGGAGGSWVGEVKSSKLSCQNGRTVTVFRKEAGKDTKIGKEKTFSGKGDTEGVYLIADPKPIEGATYYAKVKEKGDCEGDKSKDFDYPDDQPF